MSVAEIEAELEKLTPEELRAIALKSWEAFVARESEPGASNQCDDDAPELLAALDKAIAQADAAPQQGYSGNEVRARLSKWFSK